MALVSARPAGHRAVRARARHRRAADRAGLPESADRLWRWPLAVAVALFTAGGPLHALGHTDLVYYASLGGLTLGGLAVPMGLLGLARRPRRTR